MTYMIHASQMQSAASDMFAVYSCRNHQSSFTSTMANHLVLQWPPVIPYWRTLAAHNSGVWPAFKSLILTMQFDHQCHRQSLRRHDVLLHLFLIALKIQLRTVETTCSSLFAQTSAHMSGTVESGHRTWVSIHRLCSTSGKRYPSEIFRRKIIGGKMCSVCVIGVKIIL